MGANFHSTSTQLLQDALRADGVGASVSLPSEADVKEAEQVLPAEKDGTSAVGAVSNVEAGPDVEEDLLLSKAAEEDDDLCESYEVARLKGGGGGGRWGKKKGGGRWGKKVVVEEDDPVPEGASTYERFMHVLARLIKGSVDGSDFEESCRITLGTSSYELFTLDWLTTQLRVLAKSLVSVDADDAPSSGAPFLALSEYHWVIRERERDKALQVHSDDGSVSPLPEKNNELIRKRLYVWIWVCVGGHLSYRYGKDCEDREYVVRRKLAVGRQERGSRGRCGNGSMRCRCRCRQCWQTRIVNG